MTIRYENGKTVVEGDVIIRSGDGIGLDGYGVVRDIKEDEIQVDGYFGRIYMDVNKGVLENCLRAYDSVQLTAILTVFLAKEVKDLNYAIPEHCINAWIS